MSALRRAQEAVSAVLRPVPAPRLHLMRKPAEEACLALLMRLDWKWPDLSPHEQFQLAIEAVEQTMDAFIAESDVDGEAACHDRLEWLVAHLPR